MYVYMYDLYVTGVTKVSQGETSRKPKKTKQRKLFGEVLVSGPKMCFFPLPSVVLLMFWLRPQKTNVEPENHLFEEEKHLPNLHFWVPC